jgi:cytochrome c-type biogenesis protein CcmH/NrfG
MTNETAAEFIQTRSLRAAQVYGAAGLCLAVGLAMGYVAHGPQTAASTRPTTAVTAAAPAVTPGSLQGIAQAARMPAGTGHPASVGANPHAMAGGHMPTLEQMKQMADKQAAPLEEKLKTDPNNSAVLMQVGAIYHSTHQFSQAAVYYGRAAQADPKNVVVRTKLASSLYRSGDVDGALAQLNHALSIDPKDANALFDLGVIRLEGKQDGKGAVAAWQKLLKTNPQMSSDRRATVQKLMANVMTTLGDQQGMEGARK